VKISALVLFFYLVGLIGMLLPMTNALFLGLIPFALILSFLVLSFFHASTIEPKVIVCFLVIYILSFVVEAVGVKTGVVFGFYKYGDGLGFKLFDTPLIIGFNWLFLVYTSSAVVEKTKYSSVVKILLASSLMLLYDIVMEQVAPKLDMWSWENGIIPLQNYVVWFGLAVIFNSLLTILKISIENKLSSLLLATQFMFFLLLYIFLK